MSCQNENGSNALALSGNVPYNRLCSMVFWVGRTTGCELNS